MMTSICIAGGGLRTDQTSQGVLEEDEFWVNTKTKHRELYTSLLSPQNSAGVTRINKEQ